MKTVSAFAFDYRGRYETIAYVPEGTILPPGYTYKHIPLDVFHGYVAQFDVTLDEWVIVEDDWPEIKRKVDPVPGEEHDARMERYKRHVDAGEVPDFERIEKEHHEKRVVLSDQVKTRMKQHEAEVKKHE